MTHKERIKQLKTSIDVLTLSATPIPRTLQQAVGGLRDMSLMSTAPVDRRAIRTVVSQVDDVLIREAVLRELSRSGQVFYVYNRVEGLYERADRLKALVPEARIIVGHGQMSEGALEQTMLDFVEGKHDIRVATTIIESGLDIACRHHHRGSRRSVWAGPAVPTARPSWEQQRARLLLPAGSAA